MTIWANGIDRANPPPLGLMWIPDFRLAGRRRNKKVMDELTARVNQWKDGDPVQLEAVNTAWSPIVSGEIMPRLTPGLSLGRPDVVALRGMQGSVLAVARRKNELAPNDALADTVAAMLYNASMNVTADPLTNVLAAWMLAVGYWTYHQTDHTAAVKRAMTLLEQPNVSAILAELMAEARFKGA